MTFNWEIEGPCSLEARVIVKVEMRTQLAGVKATPAHKWPDSPWGLQRATLMFLLTIDFNLVFLLFYLRNCDWLSTPPSCIPQHHSWLVGWFCFTEIVTLLKCTVQWFLIYSQSCAAIVTVYFHHLQKETPRLTCARHHLALPSQPVSPGQSLSVDVPLLYIWHKCIHATCKLLCRASFAQCSVFWERLRAEGEGLRRGWVRRLASPTHWTWVWANSGRWWRTGEPGVLQSMGSQRVWHDLSDCTTFSKGHHIMAFISISFLLWLGSIPLYR